MSADRKSGEKRRLEVWRLRDGRRLVLIVQSDLLLHLATRVVVPLVRRSGFTPLEDINPGFEIDGEMFVMLSQAIAGVKASELARKVGDLDDRQPDIQRALDRLLTTSL